MGQKVSAHSIRLGIVKDFSSRYYPSDKKDWAKYVVQDKKIRKFFDTKRREFALDSVEIERNGDEVRLILNSAKPGVILGQNGEEIKNLEKELAKAIKDRKVNFKIDVVELKDPDLSAQIIADEIAVALENRSSFRLAQKRVIRRVMRAGAKGIKTKVSGRLNGVDMARSEGYSHGVVPLATFRNDIDYGFAEALTTYGIIGIKVWISKGEVINGVNEVERNRKERKNRKPFDKNRRPAKRNQASKPAEKAEVKPAEKKEAK